MIIAFIFDIIFVVIFALSSFIPISYFFKFGYALGVIPAYSFSRIIGSIQSVVFTSNQYIYRNSSFLGYYELRNFTEPTKMNVFMGGIILEPDIYSYYTILSIILLTIIFI